jgi:hypothetical protein
MSPILIGIVGFGAGTSDFASLISGSHMWLAPPVNDPKLEKDMIG